MPNRLVSFVALAVAVGTLIALRRPSHRSFRAETPGVAPEHEQTWEGEGGALPATGAQMGPDPVIRAPEDVSAGGPTADPGLGPTTEDPTRGDRVQQTIPGIH